MRIYPTNNHNIPNIYVNQDISGAGINPPIVNNRRSNRSSINIHNRFLNTEESISELVTEHESGNESDESDASTESDNYNNECCICLVVINPESINNISLPCNHILHITCILRWTIVQTNGERVTCCPLCKGRYNSKTLINNVILRYKRKLAFLITQLDDLLKYYKLNKVNQKRIQNYRTAYKNLSAKITKKNLDLINFLASIKILPLPEDITKLITASELLRQQTKGTQQKEVKLQTTCFAPFFTKLTQIFSAKS